MYTTHSHPCTLLLFTRRVYCCICSTMMPAPMRYDMYKIIQLASLSLSVCVVQYYYMHANDRYLLFSFSSNLDDRRLLLLLSSMSSSLSLSATVFRKCHFRFGSLFSRLPILTVRIRNFQCGPAALPPPPNTIHRFHQHSRVSRAAAPFGFRILETTGCDSAIRGRWPLAISNKMDCTKR